ncbi:major tail protein [Mycobacterium phage Laurie]|uniref:Major tail protein n=1 Tax=Mycobacterium phage Laurie TaxID=1874015 RepID=A0A1B2IHK0_9CAUD|nr:major tail protein [Mycobacterium phage Laurie]ANZ52315.1 major tail protein [Mycobacterium phage Laurie]
MAEFPVVKGYTLRATKINNCGRPESGAANRLVTEGFVSFNLSPEMKAAEQLEQTNAAGKVCVTDRTPPERKWWNIEATLCNVNTELITLFTGWEQVVDFADLPVGIRDKAEVDGDYGVALEVWTGGEGEDDCPVPTTDSIFSVATSGKQYGYLLLGGKEFTLGNIEIGASVSTFTISGISLAMPHWGKGPYNVAAIDGNGTPGRLLAPTGKKEHITLFRTPVPPPEPTGGAVPLDITGKFQGTTYYFGGPGGAPAADVAPEQDDGTELVLSVSGTATDGQFKLAVNGKVTDNIDYDATAADVKTALVALDDGFEASDWATSGGPLPGDDVTIVPPLGATVTISQQSLTGGTLSLDVAS